ncbi:MAG: alpha/beta fold hydrolase [Alphaproteobacteria bacterium]|nr:alpha/beta fold hydrolase [Alphaproteobacteria bacterium]
MPLARIEGGDIHYEERGGGAALAMLLPQSGGPVGVGPFIDRLAARFRVIRYDQRGTGRSAPAPAPEGMSMAGRAGELEGLLDALGIDRALLFCHSTGCGIGLAFAASRPDRVAGLVLANPWSHGDAHLVTMQRLRVAAARALDAYRYAWFNASLLFPPDYRRAHAEAFERLASNAPPQDAEGIEARLEAILAFDARPLAPGLTCPALVATAADDQLMPPWFGAELAALIPGAVHLALDGGGHMLPETRADALAGAVLEFLARSA